MSLFRKISESVSKGVSTATEKAQQTVEITRLHAQISGKRKEIERLFEDIGEAVYDGYLAKDLSLAESKVIPACEEVAAIRAEIESLEERIMQLRNEKECVCGRKVPYDTRFCPSCGHKFTVPAVAAEPSVPKESAFPYSDDFPSADPFAEPAGARQPSESPSASDWADVGMPRQIDAYDDRDPDWAADERKPAERPDSGLPPRSERASASAWPEMPAAARESSPDAQAPSEAQPVNPACPGCGKINPPSARFCPSCGTPQLYN